MGHTCETSSPLVAEVSEEADELRVWGRERRDVIPVVVGVSAREGLAAGDRFVAVLRCDHLDTLVIIWADDGRYIEEGVTGETTEANLTEHTWNVLGSFGDRVPVADPSVGEAGISCSEPSHYNGWDILKRSLRGENDSAFSAVLVDKVNDVGGSNERCKRGGCEEDASELHFGGWFGCGIVRFAK